MGPRRSVRHVLVLLAVLALAAAGCRQEQDGGGGQGETAPGITDDTVKLGGSFPLSGPVSDAGTAQSGGLKAFYEAVNADGGVKMQDGKTRRIEFVYYDDAYDPGRMVQNFRKLVDQDQVLAFTGALGTATNAAVMPTANQEEVPQVFIASGASLFSANQEENPWTLGWQPTYETEGQTLGELVAGMGKPLRVAVIRQNDDLGEAFLNGFKEGIAGSQVQVAAEQTYEPTDTTLDSQVTNVAASKSDALLSAVSVNRLQVSALTRVRQLGWKPTLLLPGFTSGVGEVLTPSGADRFFPELYTTGFVKMPNDPQWADDPAVTEYREHVQQYSPDADANLPNAIWGYATADTMVRALEGMTEMTRQGLMDSIRQLQADDVGMLLPGVTLDGSATDAPPVTGVRLLKFGQGRWNLVES